MMGKDMEAPDFYVENLPLAFCAMELILDGKGNPSDFVFTYSNRAHARLEGAVHGTIVGKKFSEMFDSRYKSWLSYYYETAYYGISHTISHYVDELEKHLLIQTFRLKKGQCGCLIQDMTELYHERMRLRQEHEKVDFLLETTTDMVFEYNAHTRTLTLDGGYERKRKRSVERCPQGLFDEGLLRREDKGRLEAAIKELRENQGTVRFDIQGCPDGGEAYRWYTVSCSEYTDRFTGHSRIVGWVRDIERQVQKQNLLKKDAMYDPLIDIYNVKTGKEMVTENLRKGTSAASNIMFLMDLDNFKRINDTFGHHRGDEVLQRFAGIVKGVFRENDIVYRMGGDEFIGFTRNVTAPEQAIDRIMKSLFREIEKAGVEGYGIGCSVGVFVSNRKTSYQYFYQMADQALYEAKRAGKNRYHVIWETGERGEGTGKKRREEPDDSSGL